MGVRALVVVLDGLSFVVAETFNWFMGSVGEWWRSQRRRMMMVTQPPNTFAVMNTFFTGEPVDVHGVRGHGDALAGRRSRVPYLWERVVGNVLVYGVPVTLPPVFVPRFAEVRPWSEYVFLPREGFEERLSVYVARLRRLLRHTWRLAIAYVQVPDQAHHYFFPAVTSDELMRVMVRWYARSLEIARGLVEASAAEEWLLLSDHGLSSVVEEYEHGPTHHRDAVAAGNTRSLPKTDLEVYETIMSML